MTRSPGSRVRAALIALCAPLVLSASGADPEPAGIEPAPVCRAAPAAQSVEDEIARLSARRELPGDPDVVMLNGRGYNYGPAPDQQLDAIRLDALKAKTELRAR